MRDTDNLIITGFMGTGKSTVAKELARRLDRPLVDMDEVIEAHLGQTIASVFETHGVEHFRRVEASLCRELAARSGLVIATGGGALIPSTSRELMSASGVVVCLTASEDEIGRRLGRSGARPLLQVPDRGASISALLCERAAAYGSIAVQVDTTGLDTAAVADRVLAAAGRPTPPVSLPVRHPQGVYCIDLGRGVLAEAGALLRRAGLDGRVAVVTDPTVQALYAATLITSLRGLGFECVCCVLPGGEESKNLGTLSHLYDELLTANMDRQGLLLALGGGVVGDLAGLAAATYLRGVAFVQVPTTLLAMVDASIGGKVAIDHSQGKNLVGAFKQPALVVADLDVLASLPSSEVQNGLAEIVKAALIDDAELFGQLEEQGPAPLQWVVVRALRVKAAIVEKDPYERGRRAVLNLGHTFAHAFEVVSGYCMPHGQAVSVGLMAAMRLSNRLGLCAPETASRVERLLLSLGLPVRYGGLDPHDVWRAMAADKKRVGDRLRFVLLRRIGEVLVTDAVSEGDVMPELECLREK